MPTRRLLLAFVPALLCAAAPLAHAQDTLGDETPAAFATAIYDHYRDPKGGIVLDKPEDIKRWFEPELADMMIDDAAQATEAGDVPDLDGDPFVDAQDWDIKDLKIAITDEAGDKAKAKVDFVNFDEAKTIILDLAMTNSGWRIHDIEWPEGTLRGLFTH